MGLLLKCYGPKSVIATSGMDFEQPGGLSENGLPSTYKHSCHREPGEQTLEGKKDSFRRLQVKRELVVRARKEN